MCVISLILCAASLTSLVFQNWDLKDLFDRGYVSKHSMSVSFMWPLTSVILSP